MKAFRYLFLILLLSSVSAELQAQRSIGLLTRDTGNHYQFERTTEVSGASRAQLYSRMRRWVNNVLEPADAFADEAEGGQESIETIAYMMMNNDRLYKNQFVSFKVQVQVADGQVTLRASDFIYHGAPNRSNGEEFDVKLERLNLLGAGEDAAVTNFETHFARILNSFERAARRR